MLLCCHITTLRSKQNKQTNANIKCLGACLLQEEKPVYFASKALTEAQKGYVATKIESLAEAWAMEKSLNQATPRIQQILIGLLLTTLE